MIYLCIFIIVIFLSRLAQGGRPNNVFFLFLAALPLILMAGYRDISVGSDTGAYPVQVYENRQNYEFNLISSIEPLYSFLGYVVYKMNGDFNTLLLLTHSLIIGFFCIGFWRLRNTAPLWLMMFFFCFLFYNMSLQLSRQSVAVAIVFWGSTYLMEKRIWIFLGAIVIGILFHKSAVTAILLIPFYYRESRKLQLLMLFGSIAGLLFYNIFLSNLTSVQVFEKYESYAEGAKFEGQLSSSEFIIRIVFLFVLYLWGGKKISSPVLTLFLMEFIINLFQIRSRFVGRMGMYIYVLYFFYLPLVMTSKQRNIKRILPIIKIAVFSITIFYWWLVYIDHVAGETYPYSSKILGID